LVNYRQTLSNEIALNRFDGLQTQEVFRCATPKES